MQFIIRVDPGLVLRIVGQGELGRDSVHGERQFGDPVAAAATLAVQDLVCSRHQYQWCIRIMSEVKPGQHLFGCYRA